MEIQTLATDDQFILKIQDGCLSLENVEPSRAVAMANRNDGLQAIYRRLFNNNRNIDFYRNHTLDSAYLNNQLTTQDIVRELICSDMFVECFLAANSNYRFVQLCFERALGRPATKSEVLQWRALLASEGIETFAKALTTSDEYLNAFGVDQIPHQRSLKLFSNEQSLPVPQQSGNSIWLGESADLSNDALRRVGGWMTVAGAIAASYMVITVGL